MTGIGSTRGEESLSVTGSTSLLADEVLLPTQELHSKLMKYLRELSRYFGI